MWRKLLELYIWETFITFSPVTQRKSLWAAFCGSSSQTEHIAWHGMIVEKLSPYISSIKNIPKAQSTGRDTRFNNFLRPHSTCIIFPLCPQYVSLYKYIYAMHVCMLPCVCVPLYRSNVPMLFSKNIFKLSTSFTSTHNFLTSRTSSRSVAVDMQQQRRHCTKHTQLVHITCTLHIEHWTL